MIRKIFPLLVALLAFTSFTGSAQKTLVHDQPDATYRMAVDLFEKQQYGAARALFEQVISQVNDPKNEVSASALYHAGVCAAELFNPDAEGLLLSFVDQHSNHPQQNMARFQLGNVKYRERRYRDAARWFASVRVRDLHPDLRNEYYFKRGYSHFMSNDDAIARQMLSEVKEPSSLYYAPANYYAGHIDYLNGNLSTALAAFKKLEQDETFGPVVPYYITHIYYLQENYDQLITYATPLLADANPRRGPEIAKLIGDAWFRKGDYTKATPYLEQYFRLAPQRISREDQYQMGLAYYSTGKHREAISHFDKVISGNDALAQNAHYHLAAAYLKVDQKRFARNAFFAAYQNKHDEAIAQDALFNYAKLSYELALDPYNEAILSFQKYIEDYPRSQRVQEAYGYLVDIFLSTRNYKDALASIEKTPINTPRLRSAYQRIAYYRGVELFNNGDFGGAVTHFDKSARYAESTSISAPALYWKGEALYRQEKYSEAITTMERFLTSPGAFSLPFYNRANYTIGYSHFKNKAYNRGITAFRKFIAERGEDARLVNDAVLRIADSYFISKEYPLALEFYDRAIAQNLLDTDYAIFQKGLVQGVLGRYEPKINTMQSLVQGFPQSNFIDDAIYEVGNTWLILDNNNQALAFFNRVIQEHPNSSYVKSAMLKSGLIYYNTNRDEQALDMFGQVVNRYPGTPESQEALVTMRNIYVGLDRVDEFIRFSQDLGFANVTTAQQDSLTYRAAENRYMQNDCANASRGFTTYLERFPRGIFTINAHFYKAECDFRAGELQQALIGYRFVIGRPKSQFTENALLRASAIEFRQGNFTAALGHYQKLEELADLAANKLEGQIGQMRSQFRLGRYQETMAIAAKVLANDKTPREVQQEAHLLTGRSAMELNRPAQARASMQSVMQIADNEAAAEAMYNLALIEFKGGSYEQTEKLIFEYLNKMSAYDYWLAKTFILLADTYLEMGNIFQAKHTLQSIIDNYAGAELRQIAIQKLDAILEQERLQNQPGGGEPVEIDLGRNIF
jgi:TolA-binding protein